MATQPMYFQEPEPNPGSGRDRKSAAHLAHGADPFMLNGVPNDDVYFFSKRIDNSRLVRQADPEAKNECLSAIAAVFIGVAAAGTVIYPHAASVIASHQIQDLKERQAELRTERRKLEIEEEKTINAARLAELAPKRNLAPPVAGQVIRLQPKSEPSFAMNELVKNR